MATLQSPRPKTRARLEIIPFIDIMFFLLATFMMVSLSMIENLGIELKLPAAISSVPTKELPEQITVSLNEEGVIFVNREQTTLEDLQVTFSELKVQKPDTRIILQGDYACDYGKVVEVFDHARRIGLTKLIIRTSKATEEKKAAMEETLNTAEPSEMNLPAGSNGNAL